MRCTQSNQPAAPRCVERDTTQTARETTRLTTLDHPLVVPTELIRNPQLSVPSLLQLCPNLLARELRNLATQIVDNLLIDNAQPLNPLATPLVVSYGCRAELRNRREGTHRAWFVARRSLRFAPLIAHTTPTRLAPRSLVAKRMLNMLILMFALRTSIARSVPTGKLRERRKEVRREVFLEPGELADLVQLDTLVRVDCEHAGEEGTRFGREERGEGEDSACRARGASRSVEGEAMRGVRRTVDLLEEHRDVVVVEGQSAAEHDVEDDAARPDVDLGSRV